MKQGDVMMDESGDCWQMKDARRARGRGMESLVYPVTIKSSDIEVHREVVGKFDRWHPDRTRNMKFCSPIEMSRWTRVG